MKNITKYNATSVFQQDLLMGGGGQLSDLKHFTAYTKDTKIVHLKEKAKFGDIVLYDKANEELIVVDGNSWKIEEYPSESYSPVGIVIIPKSHDVYGDGSFGVMSLKDMNPTTPDIGGGGLEYIHSGGAYSDISKLTNYDKVCYVGNDGVINENIQGITNFAIIPSDFNNNISSAIKNPYDSDTYYFDNTSHYIPSPFNEDDTRNKEYYSTSSPSSFNNAMSDFRGKENSKILTDLSTGQTNWRTAETIDNYFSIGYHPAACCCWRYHTEGTKQGDWYLPACGELGYIVPKRYKLIEIIRKIKNGYGDESAVFIQNVMYWTSSEYSKKDFRTISMGGGNVGYQVKDSPVSARAFMRLSF